MTDGQRYLRGFALSLLAHGLLAGLALWWFWHRPPTEPEPEPPRWEVSLMPPAEEAPPPAEASPPPPPEFAAEPAPAMPPEPQATPPMALPGGSGAPRFDIPKLGPAMGHQGPAMPNPAGTQGSAGGTALPTAPGTRTVPGFDAGDSPPTPIVRVPPTYPLEARRKKIEGWVRVELTVLEDGTVVDAQVKKADPVGVFEAAALAAVAQWRFRPATENGKAVRRRAGQTLKFELNQ